MHDDAEKLVQLLSAHRQHAQPALPQVLGFRQLVTAMRGATRPEIEPGGLESVLRTTLAELEAQGEVHSGPRGRWVVAPPAAVTGDEEVLGGLRFRGDRAYLELARRAVDCQNSAPHSRLLQPKDRRFHLLRSRLSQVGVRLLTVADLTAHLAPPQPPGPAALQVRWPDDPFTVTSWPDGESITRYSPAPQARQRERWRYPGRADLRGRELLYLPTGEYLWYEQGQFFELGPETAHLAMFWLDREWGCPLEIWWDPSAGRLHLQDVLLPRPHARAIWQCSEAEEGSPRTRLVRPTHRAIVESILRRLGCHLI